MENYNEKLRDFGPDSKELDSKINLCEYCHNSFPECNPDDIEIEFGTGVGDDNIIKCSKHKSCLTELNKSNIHKTNYSQYEKKCYVYFYSSSVYCYNDISYEEFIEFINASSAGSHMHRNWKGVKSYMRLK
jgi:hypothetical protein